LAALDVFTLGAAQQDADVVASLTLVQQLAEHFHAGAGGLLGGLDTDDFDFFADLDMPRSTRPVTTVPRPEIENTSSTGIRKAPSTARSGVGM
jgi:hypothetical protein